MLRAGMKNFKIVDGPTVSEICGNFSDFIKPKQLEFTSEGGWHHRVFITGLKKLKNARMWLIEGEIPYRKGDERMKMVVSIHYDIIDRKGKMRVPNGYFRPH